MNKDITKNRVILILLFITGIVIFFFLGIQKFNNNESVKNSSFRSKKMYSTGEKNDKFLNSLEKGDYKFFLNYSGADSLSNLSYKDKLYVLLGLLNYANYYYDNSVVDKVLKIVNNDSVGLYSGYLLNYIKGYAYELKKLYKESIKEYSEALSLCDKDKKMKSVILNQLGHVYDLQGDMDKAYFYYNKAYTLDKSNLYAAGNIGRYLFRIGKIKDSIKFFKYVVDNTDNKALLGETFLGLSSAYLYLYLYGDGNIDYIDYATKYAKKSIELYPDYPMGYVNLAFSMYLKRGDLKKNYNDIEKNLTKAIKLYTYNYKAYELLGLIYYETKEDIKDSLIMLLAAKSSVDKDVRLMNNQRDNIKKYITLEMQLLILLKKDKKQFENILKKYINNKNIRNFAILQYRRKDHGLLKGIKIDSKLFNY